MKERQLHQQLFGQCGHGEHITYFPEKEFKAHLAPKHATIERIKCKDGIHIKMTY